MKTRLLIVALAAAAFAACGDQNKTRNDKESQSTENPAAPTSPVPPVGGSSASCDQLVQDYDSWLTQYLTSVDGYLDGTVSQEQLDALGQRGEALSDQINAKGQAGLGAACWQQFTKASLKWSQAAMKISAKAMEKASEQMKNYGN